MKQPIRKWLKPGYSALLPMNSRNVQMQAKSPTCSNLTRGIHPEKSHIFFFSIEVPHSF
jgi:hypothetical protein